MVVPAHLARRALSGSAVGTLVTRRAIQTRSLAAARLVFSRHARGARGASSRRTRRALLARAALG